MAKSLRSKWRRKMRNVKRERYGKKELIRLKKMLGLPIDDETAAPDADVTMTFELPETSEKGKDVSAKDMRIIRNLVREGSDREDSDAEKEIDDVIVMTTSRKLRQSNRKLLQKETEGSSATSTDKTDQTAEEMEHDQKRVFNKKTLRDQYGNYPVWMNQKKMRTLAKSNRKTKKKDLKRLAKTPRGKQGKGRPGGGDDTSMDTVTVE